MEILESQRIVFFNFSGSKRVKQNKKTIEKPINLGPQSLIR